MLTLRLQGEQSYQSGDRPTIAGSMVDKILGTVTSSNINFATIRSLVGNNTTELPLIPEDLVTLSTTGFEFTVREPFSGLNTGLIWTRIFRNDSTIAATLDGALTAGATTASLNVTSGTIPAEGWINVNSEVMTFELLTSTSITLTSRGTFQTVAAAHSDLDAVSFTTGQESCINPWKLSIDTDGHRQFSFNNLRTTIRGA